MDQGNNLGLIQGIPFGLKDIIDVEGLPTTAHSKILKDNIAHSKMPESLHVHLV